MGRLGIFLLGSVVLVLFMRFIKPAMTSIYNITNSSSSYNLTATDQVVWQLMPYIIPLILFGILVAYLTGKIGGHRDEGGGEE